MSTLRAAGFVITMTSVVTTQRSSAAHGLGRAVLDPSRDAGLDRQKFSQDFIAELPDNHERK